MSRYVSTSKNGLTLTHVDNRRTMISISFIRFAFICSFVLQTMLQSSDNANLLDYGEQFTIDYSTGTLFANQSGKKPFLKFSDAGKHGNKLRSAGIPIDCQRTLKLKLWHKKQLQTKNLLMSSQASLVGPHLAARSRFVLTTRGNVVEEGSEGGGKRKL